MAEGNGHTFTMVGLSPPTETVTFVIGGHDFIIPALTLAALKRIKEPFLALGPGDWMAYSENIIKILALLLVEPGGPTAESIEDELSRCCSGGEASALTARFNDLLRISGFFMGEAEAASPGTGMLKDSSQNLQFEESVAEISQG